MLACLDVLAVHRDLLGAGLVELGAQAHIARLDDVELELLLAAAVRQLLEAVPQALVHTALACNPPRDLSLRDLRMLQASMNHSLLLPDTFFPNRQ